MRTTAALIVLLLTCTPAFASMEELARFLRSTQDAAVVSVPLRADGELTVSNPTVTRRSSIAIVVRQPTDTYIELRPSGTKALLLNSKHQAYLFKKGNDKAERFANDGNFAGSNFTREDLEPFELSRYRDWRISDQTASEMTVTLFPKKASQYSLVVITFDTDKKVPLKVLYYQDTVSNLVKMERDEGYVSIGQQWVPTTISMESFKLHTTSTLKLHWTQNPSFPPELFDPVFLPQASPLKWPASQEATPRAAAPQP